MLLVQKFLENKSLGDLAKEHGVYASFSKSRHKWSLNYDQIEVRDDDLLSQECRGLILSCEDGQVLTPKDGSHDHIIPGKTKVIAYPMRRFFNYGQGASANIDWNDPNLSILEKMDGTLCIVYYDPFTDQWCVATRSVPEADMVMDNGLYTFRTLFEKALQATIASSNYAGLSFQEWTAMLNKEITYCYELTTPLNRIVVSYPDYRITLIAARMTSIFQELLIETIPTFGVPCVRSYQRMSVNELVEWVSALNPMDNEGVVVRDDQFNRIKVKNPSYVLYSKARDSLGHSQRNCLEIILLGKEDDLIPYLPEEIVNNILKIKSGLQELIGYYDEFYKTAYIGAQSVCPNDKKTFALIIKGKTAWTAPFFQIWDGKCLDMRGFIEKNKVNSTFSDSFLDRILSLIK